VASEKKLVTPARILIVVAIAVAMIVFNQSHLFAPRVAPMDQHKDLPATAPNAEPNLHAPVNPPEQSEHGQPPSNEIKPTTESEHDRHTAVPSVAGHSSIPAVVPHSTVSPISIKTTQPKPHISMPAKHIAVTHPEHAIKHTAPTPKPAHAATEKNRWDFLNKMRGQ
jgi:hypothetical protein